jgi:hypothetical protein
MGQSEFDPGARDRRPWNAGRKIGGKRALKLDELRLGYGSRRRASAWRGSALAAVS